MPQLAPMARQQFTDSNGNLLASGKLYTYLTATSTPKTTYSDNAATPTQNANPIILDSRGEADIWLDSDAPYRFVLKDSNDNTLWTKDGITPTLANTPVTVATIAAMKALTGGAYPTVEVQGYYSAGDGGGGTYRWNSADSSTDNGGTIIAPNSGSGRWNRICNEGYYNVRWFGVLGDDSTSNTTKLQAALDSLTSGGTLLIPGGTSATYRSGALTVSYANTTVELQEGATLKFPTLGSGVKAFTVNANNFTVQGKGIIQGPQSGSFVLNESAIWMVGTSSASRKTGLRVLGVEIKNFGSYGVFGKWTDDIWLDRMVAHDIGHSGATFLSCDNGIISGCKAHTITPGTGSQMYGFSLTHDSTSYSSDPNAGAKSADNPFCRGWQVTDNEVYGVSWNGIDCHGAYEVQVIGNRVYGAKNGIQVPTSSGDAANYAGFTNLVSDNIVDVRNRDSTASGNENLGGGITVDGGSSQAHARVIVANNIVIGYGVKSNAAGFSIGASYVNNALIIGNVIHSWGGQAILCPNSNVSIIGNVFGGCADAADTRKYCIQHDSGTSKKIVVTGNVHDALGGNVAQGGVRLDGSTTPDLFMGANDFGQCSSSIATHSSEFHTRGGGIGNAIKSAADDATPSVKQLVGGGPGTLLITASTGAYDLTGLDDGIVDQVVTIMNLDTDVVTVKQGSSMKLTGAADVALGQYDNITLTNTFGGVWVAKGAQNN